MTKAASNRDRLDELDRQIVEAETDLMLLNTTYQRYPRQMQPSGFDSRPDFDSTILRAKLKAGIEVDNAIIRVETLKRQRAEAALEAVTDARQLASLETAAKTAKTIMEEAEAKAREARTAFASAKSALAVREERARELRQEIDRASWAQGQAVEAAAREGAQLERLEALARRQAEGWG